MTSYSARSVLSTPGGGQWRLPMTPRFYEKNDELESIKKRTMDHMKKMNHLKLDYKDWFLRQSKSFLDVLKRIQCDPTIERLIPRDITSMADFRLTYDLANKTGLNRGHMAHGWGRMEEFLDFWNRFSVLKQEMDLNVTSEVEEFCGSISRLRQDNVRQMITKMAADLDSHYADDFNFSKLSCEKDNTFVYRLPVADHKYLGLVGYVPYLLQYATKICYLVTKVYIEKE